MDYDYNYFGPCMGSFSENGCEDEIPYCDQKICSQNCLQFLNSPQGRCIDNECFCEKLTESDEMTSFRTRNQRDWSHDYQIGNI